MQRRKREEQTVRSKDDRQAPEIPLQVQSQEELKNDVADIVEEIKPD
jgi:hypothetical protein